jgi:hypothetical protein
MTPQPMCLNPRLLSQVRPAGTLPRLRKLLQFQLRLRIRTLLQVPSSQTSHLALRWHQPQLITVMASLLRSSNPLVQL